MYDFLRNLGCVNFYFVKEKCWVENEDNDIILGVLFFLLGSESVKVYVWDIVNEVFFGSFLCGDLNINYKEGLNIGVNNIDFIIVFNGELIFLDENYFDSMLVILVEGVGVDNINIVVVRVLFKDLLLK